MNAGRIEALASPRDVYAKPATLFAARFIGSPQMNLWRTDGPDCGFADALGVTRPAGSRTLVVGVRPEHVLLDPRGVRGVVALRETLGRDALLHVEAAGSRLLVLLDSQETTVGQGDEIALSVERASWHFFDAETGLRVDDLAAASPADAVSSREG